MSNQIPTTPPSGFRDFQPQDCVLRARAIETISRVYRSYGFHPIATSAVEDLAVLLGKGGGENEKLIFKILKRGEKLEEAKASGELADMGLRFDLTLPLARYYSKYGSTLPHPFKAFNIGPVWRAERAQKGRYREFYQCDADIIGSESVQCEVDVISAILSAFKALGVEGVTVHLNDRRLLHSILEKSDVKPELRGEVCVLLDKLDKMDKKEIGAELEKITSAPIADALMSFADAAEPDTVKLREINAEAMDRLAAVTELVGVGARLSPMLVRGFDYYTSTVFEFRHPKFSGSIGGGGRYDRLTEKFGASSVPACGGSIGFERLLLILAETPHAQASSGKRVCVTVFNEELRPQTLELAAKLRNLKIPGLLVDVYPGSAKLKAQFKYADTTGADVALVMGPDEAAKGVVNRKILKTGEEKAMTFDELAASLR